MTTDNTQELDEILADLDLRVDSGQAYIFDTSEAIERILDWHNRQVEQAMAKFHLKKGVKYDVKASDSVIVITHTNKLKERDDDQL